jgi:hypothetical protein
MGANNGKVIWSKSRKREDDLCARPLSSAIWAFSLIRSNGTKLPIGVEMRMRIDEPTILTFMKVSAFAKDFGIF